jgi:hypothetical protein
MHKLETKPKAAALEKAPFGPGFRAEEIPETTDRLEVWASSFNDPGSDYCEFRLVDKKGNTLATRRIEGY